MSREYFLRTSVLLERSHSSGGHRADTDPRTGRTLRAGVALATLALAAGCSADTQPKPDTSSTTLDYEMVLLERIDNSQCASPSPSASTEGVVGKVLNSLALPLKVQGAVLYGGEHGRGHSPASPRPFVVATRPTGKPTNGTTSPSPSRTTASPSPTATRTTVAPEPSITRTTSPSAAPMPSATSIPEVYPTTTAPWQQAESKIGAAVGGTLASVSPSASPGIERPAPLDWDSYCERTTARIEVCTGMKLPQDVSDNPTQPGCTEYTTNLFRLDYLKKETIPLQIGERYVITGGLPVTEVR